MIRSEVSGLSGLEAMSEMVKMARGNRRSRFLMTYDEVKDRYWVGELGLEIEQDVIIYTGRLRLIMDLTHEQMNGFLLAATELTRRGDKSGNN